MYIVLAWQRLFQDAVISDCFYSRMLYYAVVRFWLLVNTKHATHISFYILETIYVRLHIWSHHPNGAEIQGGGY